MWSVLPRRSHAYPAIAGLLLSSVAPALAQEAAVADPATDMLDPGSPLADLPGLGVDWPDLSVPDGDGSDPAAAAAAVDLTTEQRYSVVLEGLDGIADDRLRARFDELSALKTAKDRDANVAQIDRRARQDEQLLADLLRSYGYYDALVTARVDSDPATRRITVTLAAEPGPVYRFVDVETPGLAAAGNKADALAGAFPIKPQDPVDAERVIAAEASLQTKLGREGFAFGTVADPDIVIDHATRTATLSLPVETGQAQRFGAIAIDGTRLFGTRHLGRIARFRPGQPYDAALVEDYRRALIQTGLVSTVQIKPRPGAEPGVVDIVTKLEPAPPRTIAGELGYGTGEGARIEASWTHRNLIKPEGAVTVRGVAGTREQLASLSLRRNNYKGRDRVLTGLVSAARIRRDAYDAKTFTLAGGLERQTNIIWQKKWTWSLGAELIASDERDTVGFSGIPRRRTFFIAAFPTSLSYDGSDDLLDPKSGYRLSGRLSPEASFQAGNFQYARAQIDASAYQPVGDRVVVAGRIRLGSILGASRDRIAPSRRFYAGGGASVRGYGFQNIGPVDLNGDPVGGRSLAEFAVETRIRFGNFGVVPFLDAGNLYTKTYPDFSGLRYGAGIGARYHSSFGPIRVDVGTPLNRRPGDARVAVYVSLGQAF